MENSNYSVTLENLQSSTFYYYRVVSTNILNSTNSDIYTFTTLAIGPPRNFAITVAGTESLTFSWSAPHNVESDAVTILFYTLSCSSTSQNSTSLVVPTEGNITLHEFIPGTTYTCTVYATTNEGPGTRVSETATTEEVSGSGSDSKSGSGSGSGSDSGSGSGSSYPCPTCHQYAYCDTMEGVCRCYSGYTGDGKQYCEDINECEYGDPCSSYGEYGVCINTNGSYYCECEDGYQYTYENGEYSCEREVYRYPGQVISDRDGCNPEDTAQNRYEIGVEIHSFIRKEVERRFGSAITSGSGMDTPTPPGMDTPTSL